MRAASLVPVCILQQTGTGRGRPTVGRESSLFADALLIDFRP